MKDNKQFDVLQKLLAELDGLDCPPLEEEREQRILRKVKALCEKEEASQIRRRPRKGRAWKKLREELDRLRQRRDQRQVSENTEEANTRET